MAQLELIKHKFYFNILYKLLLGESKVLQYSCKVRHSSAISDTFASIVGVTNDTGLWDTELAWYSLRTTHGICLSGLELALGIYGWFEAYLTLPDRWCSCKPSKISWTLCDQLHLHLSHNKYWLLPRCYDLVRSHKASIPELDYVARSFVRLSNHTRSVTMRNVLRTNYHKTIDHFE